MTINLPRRQKPDRPLPFGYKISWWAFRTENTQEVVDAIQLMGRHEANWEHGIEHACQGHRFVTPPVKGWVFAVGPTLVPVDPRQKRESAKPTDAELEKLLILSKKFGEVQAYSSYRIVGYYLWAKATNGKLDRGFGYLGETGETFWNEGSAATEELLGIRFFDMTCAEATSDDLDERDRYFDRDDMTFPSEKIVLQISGVWSLNPAELDQLEDSSPSMGCLGTLSKYLE